MTSRKCLPTGAATTERSVSDVTRSILFFTSVLFLIATSLVDCGDCFSAPVTRATSSSSSSSSPLRKEIMFSSSAGGAASSAVSVFSRGGVAARYGSSAGVAGRSVLRSATSIGEGFGFPSATSGRHGTFITASARSPGLFASIRGGGAGFNHRSALKTTTTLRMSTATPTTDATATASEASGDGMTAGEKLGALRKRMKELDIDVYLVPSDDPHLSEYVPSAYMRRGFLTGFMGSAGTAVVTDGEAFLWTDSRYWNEAGIALDADHWALQKAGLPETKTIPKWLSERAIGHYKEHSKPLRVGLDPYVHSASYIKELEDAFSSASKDEFDDADTEASADVKIGVLDTLSDNLVDEIWASDRPEVPYSPFRVHPVEFAGKSIAEKVDLIREEMKTKKATMSVFCTLDDVAYLLNVRAKGDIDTCPVGIAYATVTDDDVTLYCDPRKLASDEVKIHLAEVIIKPYEDIVPDIEAHCSQEDASNKVWIDKTRANYALCSAIPEKCLVNSQNAITPMKARKNDAELEGMRQAHVVDGAAMAKFISWLEHTVVEEGRSVSEVEIDEKLTGFRAEQPGFVECSFPTIAGVGPNGAIIHYRAEAGSDLLRYLDQDQPILLDSGGQYAYGTTDVTRTWHFGVPTEEFADTYTRVLKGNIGVDQMVFPEGTPGFVLDVYARQWLWKTAKDYGHGTGHGVGAALNVHEGPMSISPRFANKEGLKQGMVLSNEPGYYEDGNYGIRIENLLEIQYVNPEDAEETDKAGEKEEAASKKYLKFGKLTLIPIQKNLINVKLMSEEELDWLDSYHKEVYDKVSPLLESGGLAMEWLRKSCDPIDRSGRDAK